MVGVVFCPEGYPQSNRPVSIRPDLVMHVADKNCKITRGVDCCTRLAGTETRDYCVPCCKASYLVQDMRIQEWRRPTRMWFGKTPRKGICWQPCLCLQPHNGMKVFLSASTILIPFPISFDICRAHTARTYTMDTPGPCRKSVTPRSNVFQ